MQRAKNVLQGFPAICKVEGVLKNVHESECTDGKKGCRRQEKFKCENLVSKDIGTTYLVANIAIPTDLVWVRGWFI